MNSLYWLVMVKLEVEYIDAKVVRIKYWCTMSKEFLQLYLPKEWLCQSCLWANPKLCKCQNILLPWHSQWPVDPLDHDVSACVLNSLSLNGVGGFVVLGGQGGVTSAAITFHWEDTPGVTAVGEQNIFLGDKGAHCAHLVTNTILFTPITRALLLW